MFEIITIDGQRRRWTSPGYIWKFGLKHGSKDVTDKTIVEVLRVNDDDETDLVAVFTEVIAVGNVDEGTSILMPRERRITECPRCGFAEINH